VTGESENDPVHDDLARDDPARSGAMIRPFLDRGHAGGLDAGSVVPGGNRIRPFLVTAGRTTGASDIALEAQVMITPQGETAVDTLSFEYRDIVCLCEQPLAVAEIAARLSLHLGVIRVLVGDLKHQGMVTTFEPEVDPTDDVDTILRVINGLRQRS
jgi:Protein of unknown function (DUF742)